MNVNISRFTRWNNIPWFCNIQSVFSSMASVCAWAGHTVSEMSPGGHMSLCLVYRFDWGGEFDQTEDSWQLTTFIKTDGLIFSRISCVEDSIWIIVFDAAILFLVFYSWFSRSLSNLLLLCFVTVTVCRFVNVTLWRCFVTMRPFVTVKVWFSKNI